MERIVPGILLAAGWLFLLLKGSLYHFTAAIFLITAIGGYEYLKMISKPKPALGRHYFLIPLIMTPLVGAALTNSVEGMQMGLICGFLLTTFFILFNYTKIVADSFVFFSQSVMGIVYIGCLFSFLLLLYRLPQGNFWMIVLVAITAGSDTGAYVIGSRYGKHKLCPSVSPKKTVEGAVGGLFFGILFGVVAGLIVLPDEDVVFNILLAAVLVAASIVGDLTESIIKRGTDTKDSGKLLAGHGGILDRLDSMLFAAPFLYFMLIFVRGL